MRGQPWRFKEWVVCDPYTTGNQLIDSFHSEQQANDWLATKIAEDEDGYSGCIVYPVEDALREYGTTDQQRKHAAAIARLRRGA